jgi:hypothetical protein
MKKLGIIIIFLIAIAIFALVVWSKYGIKFGNVNISLNGDKQILSENVINFLEDIQFKDFKKAATYHTEEDQKNVDIPKLIEEKFFVKPEFLDITKYEVKTIDIDRSGNRARVKTRTIFKILNTGEIKDLEMIFYFKKAQDGKWYMELQSSLK